MAQIDPKCPAIINICRTRVTLLQADGTPDDGAGNGYVSDKEVTLAITEDREDGTRRTVRSGCGCLLASSRDPDLFLGHTLERVAGVWEPALESLLLGATPLYDTSTVPVIVGINYATDDFSCDAAVREVGFEAWGKAYLGSGPDPDLGWVHFVFPRTRWAKGPSTLGADFVTPTLTAFTLSNGNWGSGPYDDVPNDGTSPVLITQYAQFLTATEPPTATCGLTTVPA